MDDGKLLTCDEVGSIIGCSGRYVREVLVRERGLRAIVLVRTAKRNILAFRRVDVDDWCAKQARKGV